MISSGAPGSHRPRNMTAQPPSRDASWRTWPRALRRTCRKCPPQGVETCAARRTTCARRRNPCEAAIQEALLSAGRAHGPSGRVRRRSDARHLAADSSGRRNTCINTNGAADAVAAPQRSADAAASRQRRIRERAHLIRAFLGQADHARRRVTSRRRRHRWRTAGRHARRRSGRLLPLLLEHVDAVVHARLRNRLLHI